VKNKATKVHTNTGMENFRLRVFRAVAKHLHFRRAAEELCLTQPAVTQQIKALEQHLGVQLFDRSGARISLTPAGTMLLKYARKPGNSNVRARLFSLELKSWSTTSSSYRMTLSSNGMMTVV
jgi:DNA-binding transcriptional LysR family regulator